MYKFEFNGFLDGSDSDVCILPVKERVIIDKFDYIVL